MVRVIRTLKDPVRELDQAVEDLRKDPSIWNLFTEEQRQAFMEEAARVRDRRLEVVS
jgi:hypothetical protein